MINEGFFFIEPRSVTLFSQNKTETIYGNIIDYGILIKNEPIYYVFKIVEQIAN